jgi:2-hydroxy-6-oxonona-2,4-dienedioate hydrolase
MTSAGSTRALEWFELSDGGRVRYELLGAGTATPVALTAAGHGTAAQLRPLAEALAGDRRVLIWDGRNSGGSDICFDYRHEPDLACADLLELVDGLELGPVDLLGGAAGARVGVLTAGRAPATVRRLVLWSPVGGWFAGANLAGTRYIPYVIAAYAGGMEAVADVPRMAALIAANPRNRDLLMRWEVEPFVARMKEWVQDFLVTPGELLMTLTDDDLRAVTAPTLVLASDDSAHPRELAELMAARIPGARLQGPAHWDDRAWWSDYTRGTHFDVWRVLAPEILTFLDTEA